MIYKNNKYTYDNASKLISNFTIDELISHIKYKDIKFRTIQTLSNIVITNLIITVIDY